MELIVGLVILVPMIGLALLIKALFDASEAKKLAHKLEARVHQLEAALPKPSSSPDPATKSSAPSPDPVPTHAAPGAKSFSPTPPEKQPAPRSPAPEPEISHKTPGPPPLPPQIKSEEKPVLSGWRKKLQDFIDHPLDSVNWEQFMGVKLFAWLGGLALFLAVSFFVKYSFERNLIPPELRVTLGFLAGLGLLVGGLVLKRKQYQVTSQTLIATGVLTLYAVTFACRSIYHFAWFGMIPTFLLMTVITVTAFFLAVRLKAMVVAILGMLGGFLTPLLLSSGQDHPVGLFSYIALLDAGLLAVAYHRRWNFLSLFAALGTLLMQGGWVIEFFTLAKLNVPLIAMTGFNLLFLVACAFFQSRKRLNVWLESATTLLPVFTFVFLLYLVFRMRTDTFQWQFFTLLLVTDLVLLSLSVLSRRFRLMEAVTGLMSFGLLMVWIVFRLEPSLLYWGLGGILVLAMVHVGFPVLAQRWRPEPELEVSPSWWIHLVPTAALLLTLIPILKLDESPFLIWPVILGINLLAVGVAALSSSILVLVLGLLFTVVNLLVWIVKLPQDPTRLPETLVVVTGFALLFFGLCLALERLDLKKRLERWTTILGLPKAWDPAEIIRPLAPALSAALPFFLLLMLTVRLPLVNPSPVFAVGLIMTLLLLALARWNRSRLDWLPLVALGASGVMQLAWFNNHFTTSQAGLALTWNLVFFALFLLYPFVFPATHEKPEHRFAWITSALAGPIHFLLIYWLIEKAWPNDFMGLIPAAFALIAGVLLFLVLQRPFINPKVRLEILAWVGGVTLFFVTLIFPIQFDREWITIAWALEGAALLWLFHHVPHRGLTWTGLALLQISFIRLALNPAVLSYHTRSETPLLNWYLYAYGTVAVCFFVAANLMAPPRHLLKGRDTRPLLYAMGTVLVFLLMNIEIADYFTREGSRVLTFKFSGNFARDMSYSIGWALFAFCLLLVGIKKSLKSVRYASLGLLGVTLFKLFFHDLAHLAQLYRIGALVVVAAIAILASFLYQKHLTDSR